MKILYLLRYYPTLSESFVRQEIGGMKKAGLHVAVAALGSRYDGYLAEDLPVVPLLDVPRRPFAGRLSAPTLGQRWLARWQRSKDVARLPWLARRVAEFDRIHVHFAGEAAEWAVALHLDLGLPFSVTVHAADLFKPRPTLDEVLGLADTVLTVSQHNVEALAARGVRARLVRCGPDLERWRPQPMPSGPLRVAFVGRKVPKKGLDTLLEAWAQLESGDQRLDIVSDAKPQGLPGVTWHGLLSPARVRDLLTSTHLVALPCRRAPDGDLDGVPVVLMEALALGRAVLSTTVSGIPELVEAAGPEATGWLVPPDDPAALAHALTAIQAAPDELARRGARGPDTLRRRDFTLEAQIQGLLAAWRRLDS